MPQQFLGLAHHASAGAVEPVALQDPAVLRVRRLVLEVEVFHPEDSLDQVEDTLGGPDVALDDALLRNLLKVDVDLQENRTDYLSLGLGSFHDVVEGIEQEAGDLALLQALVLAHPGDQAETRVDELDQLREPSILRLRRLWAPL